MKYEELELLLIEHLKESGEIRADILWLKRAFWALTALWGTFVAAVGANMVYAKP